MIVQRQRQRHMLRRIQVAIGFTVFTFDGVAIACFADYLSKTD